MRDKGIVGARHHLRTNYKTLQRENSNSIVLTFDNPILPSEVKTAFELCKVDIFIPEPIRCNICNEFGHLKFNCTKAPKCGKCSSTDKNHDSKICKPSDSDYCCPNCNEAHPAWSRKCSKYLFEKSICNYKQPTSINISATKTDCI